jgi:hypothetical protein
VELARTGRVALARGDRGIRERVQRRLAAGAEDAAGWTGGGV